MVVLLFSYWFVESPCILFFFAPQAPPIFETRPPDVVQVELELAI